MTRRSFIRAGVVLSAVLAAGTARADTFIVTLDTAPLTGTHVLVFGLTNFDAGSNTAVLSEFSFGGGSAVAGSEDCTLGGFVSGLGCTGDLATSVVLQDLDPFGAFFTQQFTPGASLTFRLSITNNYAGGTPDQLAMSVCDDTLSTCYSDDAGTGALLLLDFSGAPLAPSSFIASGASAQNLGAPSVAQVAEPGTALLLLLGAGGARAVARRHQRPW